MTSTGPATGTRIRVGDALVSRLAARCALGVPGVLALHADPGQALIGIADSGLGPAAPRRQPAGARATVQDGSVQVALTVVTSLGYNCRDLAQAVQLQVGAQVQAYTGLAVVVTVTIAEIHLD